VNMQPFTWKRSSSSSYYCTTLVDRGVYIQDCTVIDATDKKQGSSMDFRLLKPITALTRCVLFVHLLVPLPMSLSLGLHPVPRVREAALLALGASLRGRK
jgi:hypothetical protein